MPVKISLTCALVSAAGFMLQSIEASPQKYRSIRAQFRDGSPEFRKAVAVAMQERGKLTHWDAQLLWVRFPEARRECYVDYATNLAEERLVLAALASQVRAR